MTNSQLLRILGRTPSPAIYKEFDINVLTGTYAVGDVLSDGLIVLNCVGLTMKGLVTVKQVYLFEKRDALDSFTSIEAELRFTRDMTFSPPAQNAPFTPPTSYKKDNGKIVVETTDWEDYNEASGDKHAIAEKSLDGAKKVMPVDEDSLSLGLTVTTQTAVTYTADQALSGLVIFEPH